MTTSSNNLAKSTINMQSVLNKKNLNSHLLISSTTSNLKKVLTDHILQIPDIRDISQASPEFNDLVLHVCNCLEELTHSSKVNDKSKSGKKLPKKQIVIDVLICIFQTLMNQNAVESLIEFYHARDLIRVEGKKIETFFEKACGFLKIVCGVIMRGLGSPH